MKRLGNFPGKWSNIAIKFYSIILIELFHIQCYSIERNIHGKDRSVFCTNVLHQSSPIPWLGMKVTTNRCSTLQYLGYYYAPHQLAMEVFWSTCKTLRNRVLPRSPMQFHQIHSGRGFKDGKGGRSHQFPSLCSQVSNKLMHRSIIK